jgi:PPIC-type PPIASE domain
MQRWITTVVGLAAVVFAFWLVGRGYHPPAAVGHRPSPGRASDASDDDGGDLMYAYGDGGAPSDDAAPPLLLSDLIGPDTRVDGGAGVTLPDGTPVPALPVSVPRQIRFGVVLVSYAGAQPSAGGGRPAARSKGEAKALADKLVGAAQQDFHAAVQQGDTGSADDIGQVKVGILEPAPEYVLFTLPVNGVSGPVDTPRGYWIVKRLE